MEKSKFFSMKTKKKSDEKTASEAEVSSALSEVEVNELLAQVEETIKTVAEVEAEQPVVAPVVETKVEVIKSKTKKAYNIYKDEKTRTYVMDIITYSGEGDNLKLSIETKNLGVSQPMAMYEIKRIFTDKLILKRGDK